jgi:hypothetical protein
MTALGHDFRFIATAMTDASQMLKFRACSYGFLDHTLNHPIRTPLPPLPHLPIGGLPASK